MQPKRDSMVGTHDLPRRYQTEQRIDGSNQPPDPTNKHQNTDILSLSYKYFAEFIPNPSEKTDNITDRDIY